MNITTRYNRSALLFCCLIAGMQSSAKADSPASWTGCYAGANTGYGWADVEGTDLAMLSPAVIQNNRPVGSATADGGVIGGQAGCDYQIDHWVFGGQILADYADLTGSHQFINGSSPSDRMKYDVKAFGSITGRLGYAFHPNTLAYIKTGAAWTETKHTDADPSPNLQYTGSSEITRNGWLIGIGLEHSIRRNISVFIEYDYMDFGKAATDVPYSDGQNWRFSFKQEMSYIGLGMNYRFQ